MENNNYITIQGWMVNELKLKGSELITYALIYGFCQDGDSVFSGTQKYISEWLGLNRSSANQVLKRLVDKGFILKIEKKFNGIVCYDYKINTLLGNQTGVDVWKPENGVAKQNNPVRKPDTTLLGNQTHYNNIYNNIYNNKEKSKKEINFKGKEKYVYDLSEELEDRLSKHKELDLSFIKKLDWLNEWLDWLDYRKSLKKPYKTQNGMENQMKLLAKMANNDLKYAKRMLKVSKQQEWQGFNFLDEETLIKYENQNNEQDAVESRTVPKREQQKKVVPRTRKSNNDWNGYN